jgi:hypothetical protein
MISKRIGFCTLCIIVSAWMEPGFARAQHAGDVLVQVVDGKLVTGGSSPGGVNIGQRTFIGAFPTGYSIDSPGFNALGEGSVNLPAGADALPPNAPLGWDFSTMRVDDLAANLLYWNGADADGVPGLTSSDVRFGPLPGPNYRFNMLSFDYFVDGSDIDAPGGVIGDSGSDGSLHVHRFFNVADGDANPATNPAAGIYLVALRLRMPGVRTADPSYLLFSTPGASPQALTSAAAPWVAAVADTLVLLGDYNKNGVVEAADYTVWRNTLSNTGFALPADGDASGTVDAADFFAWRENYGKTSPTTDGGAAGAASIPEPASLLSAVLSLAALIGTSLRTPAPIFNGHCGRRPWTPRASPDTL